MTWGRARGEPLSEAELAQRREALRAASSSRALRTECVHGHAFTRANTYYHPATGHRECRRCRTERQRAYRERRRMGGGREVEGRFTWQTSGPARLPQAGGSRHHYERGESHGNSEGTTEPPR